MFSLEAAQYTAMVVNITLAIIMYLSLFMDSSRNRVYLKSRLLIAVSLTCLALQYLLQMVFGFRADGEDVGAVVNCLFYNNSEFITAISLFNLQTVGRVPRQHYVAWAVSELMLVMFVLIGYQQFHSLHIKYYVHGMLTVYCLSSVYCTYYQMRGFRKMSKTMEQDLGNPVNNLRTHMLVGTIYFAICVLLSPFLLMHSTMLILYCPIVMFIFCWFCSSLLTLDYNAEQVLEVLDEDLSNADDEMAEFTSEDAEKLRIAINQWIADKRYSNKNLSIVSLANELGVTNRRILASFIKNQYGCTFSSWINAVRVNAAMDYIKANPHFTNESISDECGFSSRTYFQTIFKNVTGMTPKEWRSR